MFICGLLFQWIRITFKWEDMSICGLLFQWIMITFKWEDMSICGLLFQWANTNIPNVYCWSSRKQLKINLFWPWYRLKIAEMTLSNNHSLKNYKLAWTQTSINNQLGEYLLFLLSYFFFHLAIASSFYIISHLSKNFMKNYIQ